MRGAGRYTGSRCLPVRKMEETGVYVGTWVFITRIRYALGQRRGRVIASFEGRPCGNEIAAGDTGPTRSRKNITELHPESRLLVSINDIEENGVGRGTGLDHFA